MCPDGRQKGFPFLTIPCFLWCSTYPSVARNFYGEKASYFPFFQHRYFTTRAIFCQAEVSPKSDFCSTLPPQRFCGGSYYLFCQNLLAISASAYSLSIHKAGLKLLLTKGDTTGVAADRSGDLPAFNSSDRRIFG